MEKIERILSEIAKTLKEIRDIHRERLDLDKKDSENIGETMLKTFEKSLEGGMKIGEKVGERVLGRAVNNMLGVKEKIDIKGLAPPEDDRK